MEPVGNKIGNYENFIYRISNGIDRKIGIISLSILAVVIAASIRFGKWKIGVKFVSVSDLCSGVVSFFVPKNKDSKAVEFKEGLKYCDPKQMKICKVWRSDVNGNNFNEMAANLISAIKKLNSKTKAWKSGNEEALNLFETVKISKSGTINCIPADFRKNENLLDEKKTFTHLIKGIQQLHDRVKYHQHISEYKKKVEYLLLVNTMQDNVDGKEPFLDASSTLAILVGAVKELSEISTFLRSLAKLSNNPIDSDDKIDQKNEFTEGLKYCKQAQVREIWTIFSDFPKVKNFHSQTAVLISAIKELKVKVWKLQTKGRAHSSVIVLNAFESMKIVEADDEIYIDNIPDEWKNNNKKASLEEEYAISQLLNGIQELQEKLDAHPKINEHKKELKYFEMIFSREKKIIFSPQLDNLEKMAIFVGAVQEQHQILEKLKAEERVASGKEKKLIS